MSTSLQSSDASYTETRSKSGILTPDSEPSPEISSAINGRKRKRDSSNSIQDLLNDPFIVRPHRSLVFAKPRSLQPILLLPRTELRLSYLDNGVSSAPLPQSRFFESHIKILELEARLGSRPMILIARLDDGKSIYAVEREDRGLYVLCKLGSWVNLETLKGNAAASRSDHFLKTAIGSSFTQGSSESGLGSTITPEASKYSKKQRLAIEAIQTLVKRPPPQLPTVEAPDSQFTPVACTPTVANACVIQNPVAGLDEQRKDEPIPTSEIVEPTPAELFDTIRAQYLEALYMSKASLAYFPKGPLSRARAAFHLDFDSTLEMQDLIEFLESMILKTATMDKKFKETMPELVKAMSADFLSGDEAIKPSKKRKSKKMKPGKNGLYPCEDELIRKWLNNNRDDDLGILNESAIKSRIGELRVREIQLQMIVLLEVLALKSLTNVAAGDSELPSAMPSGNVETKKEKRSKNKKNEELEALIDIHIDRLCIWQEVSSESGTSHVQTTFDTNASSGGLTGIGKHETNALRDFCVEIIGPFFSARLPDLCSTINHKLGGPMAKPPPRQKLVKSASASSSLSRPGAATRRPVLGKSRQSLQRVLTDERRARSVSRGTPDSAAISLMRSVSMSTVPRLKRETSEALSLASIPSIESQQASKKDILNKKRYSQREVDMSVPPSAAADLKTKKQAAVEAELQEAIAALKKPNRQLAGRMLVETAEQRAISTSRSARKMTKPIRNPLFQGAQSVQIMATPKNNRHKDMMAAPKSVVENNATPQKSSQDIIPASSAGRVPESIVRPRSSTQANTSSLAPHAHPPREQNPFNLTETPSRPSSRARANHFQSLDFPPSSPDFVRGANSSKEEFQFAVPNSVVRNPFAASRNSNAGELEVIEATPTKPRGRSGSIRSLASFAPSALPSFSQRRDSLPPALIDDAPKLAAIMEDTRGIGKENVPPSFVKSMGGNGKMGESDSIYKTLGWEDDDDLDDLAY